MPCQYMGKPQISVSLMLLREKFQKLFPNSFDALMYCHLGAVTHSTDFGIGVAIQRKQQKPLPLGGGAGIQNTEDMQIPAPPPPPPRPAASAPGTWVERSCGRLENWKGQVNPKPLNAQSFFQGFGHLTADLDKGVLSDGGHPTYAAVFHSAKVAERTKGGLTHKWKNHWRLKRLRRRRKSASWKTSRRYF